MAQPRVGRVGDGFWLHRGVDHHPLELRKLQFGRDHCAGRFLCNRNPGGPSHLALWSCPPAGEDHSRLAEFVDPAGFLRSRRGRDAREVIGLNLPEQQQNNG
jgi:hypothetical protein